MVEASLKREINELKGIIDELAIPNGDLKKMTKSENRKILTLIAIGMNKDSKEHETTQS